MISFQAVREELEREKSKLTAEFKRAGSFREAADGELNTVSRLRDEASAKAAELEASLQSTKVQPTITLTVTLS